MVEFHTAHIFRTTDWGWTTLGAGHAHIKVRLAGTRLRKVASADAAACNLNYAISTCEGAETSERGLALLKQIAGS